MRWDLAIFDIDGTLADSFPFFIGIQNRLAAMHGFRRIEAEEVEALRGTRRAVSRDETLVAASGWGPRA